MCVMVQIDNGLSPGRCQAIIGNNAGILLIGSLGIKSNETLIEIHKFSFKKIPSKMSSGKRRPSCLGFNVLTELMPTDHPVNWRIWWVQMGKAYISSTKIIVQILIQIQTNNLTGKWGLGLGWGLGDITPFFPLLNCPFFQTQYQTPGVCGRTSYRKIPRSL